MDSPAVILGPEQIEADLLKLRWKRKPGWLFGGSRDATPTTDELIDLQNKLGGEASSFGYVISPGGIMDVGAPRNDTVSDDMFHHIANMFITEVEKCSPSDLRKIYLNLAESNEGFEAAVNDFDEESVEEIPSGDD